MQVLLGGKGEIQHIISEYSWQGIFPDPNIGHHGTGRDIHCQIIPNLGIKGNKETSFGWKGGSNKSHCYYKVMQDILQ